MMPYNGQSLAKPRPVRPTIHPLRPIISPAPSTAPSPSMSRRSSSGSSSGLSGKCVHFPCNPAHMSKSFYTHSREIYDRSPIIPSGEDLDIPSCKSEEGSWIKCLQRKAREAAQEGHAPPHTSLRALDPSAEHDHQTVSPCSETPSLTHDEYSSCSESDDLGHTPISSSASSMCSPAFAHCRTASLEMFMSMAVRDEATIDWSGQGDVEMGSDEEDAAEPEPAPSIRFTSDPSQPRKLGMCALGKFTRQSLYENDAFGGF